MFALLTIQYVKNTIQAILHIQFLKSSEGGRKLAIRSSVPFQALYGLDIAFKEDKVYYLKTFFCSSELMLVILRMVITAIAIEGDTIQVDNPNTLAIKSFQIHLLIITCSLNLLNN